MAEKIPSLNNFWQRLKQNLNDQYMRNYYLKRLRWFVAGFSLGALMLAVLLMFIFVFSRGKICQWLKCQGNLAQSVIVNDDQFSDEQKNSYLEEQLAQLEQTELELIRAFDKLDEQSSRFDNVQEGENSQTNKTYQVKSGDCLWTIAEKLLGDGMRWGELYELNSGVIGNNPDLIFPNTQLILP